MVDEFPGRQGEMVYYCTNCAARYGIDELLYTCPSCGGVLLLEDMNFDCMLPQGATYWKSLFDSRCQTRKNSLRGIFRFYELMAPVLEEEDIVYLGEGGTPIVEASPCLAAQIGRRFAFKNEGQNPSASFKDRGMALAFSYLKALARKHDWEQVLTICASTGDTSAAAAMYGAYVGGPIKTVVLLPQGKVTPQQLSQPLGSGVEVIELPGVFDDCMKVVETLAERYRVALLNSKNSWRILGQESYVYEIAQWYAWQLGDKALFVPVGNAGNITSVLSGLLKLHRLGLIDALPRLFGVQSDHADPVWRYYENEPKRQSYHSVKVRDSVAQAAMIGNPVSFPRVRVLVEKFEAAGGFFQMVQVAEQAVMDAMLLANKHGHIACTQGGECLAGLIKAIECGLVHPDCMIILDATAHSLKFADFQDMYFSNAFPPAYEVTAKPEFVNKPQIMFTPKDKETLSDGEFTRVAVEKIAAQLGLRDK